MKFLPTSHSMHLFAKLQMHLVQTENYGLYRLF